MLEAEVTGGGGCSLGAAAGEGDLVLMVEEGEAAPLEAASR